MTTTASTPALAAAIATQRLPGLGNLVRKELAEWRRGRRASVVAFATIAIFALSAGNARLTAWLVSILPPEPGDGPAKVLSVLPIDNILAAVGTQFTVLAVIFATISLLIVERDGGTLAWTASKPVSRASIIVSKWLVATGILWLAAVVIPLALTAAIVWILYGPPPVGSLVVMAILLATVPAIFVALNLAAATVVPTQAGVAGIGFAAFVAPVLIGGLVPAIVPFVPTAISDWAVTVAVGGPISIVAPIAWGVGLAALLLVARHRLERMEL